MNSPEACRRRGGRWRRYRAREGARLVPIERGDDGEASGSGGLAGGHRSDVGDDEGGDCTTYLDGIDVLASGLGRAWAHSTVGSMARKVTRLDCQTHAPN